MCCAYMLEYKAENETATIAATITTSPIATSSYGCNELAYHEQFRIQCAVQFRSLVSGQLRAKFVVFDSIGISSPASTALSARARHGSEARSPTTTS